MSQTDEPSSDQGPGPLDVQGAARLLEQTRRRAERELDFRGPWASAVAAAAVLGAFGSVWLSVRHQHPYKGPTPAGLAGLWALVALRIATVVIAYRQANRGVTRSPTNRQRAEGAALIAALVTVYVVMAALAHAEASNGVVYGVYAATASVLVIGVFGAARSATLGQWLQLGMAIMVMFVAAGSAFAGPSGVWLSDGVGLCVTLLVYSAIQAWSRRPLP